MKMPPRLFAEQLLLWLALGKSRERNGDIGGAEKALRRAVELAPNYGDNHWTLGNNLLRQGKSEDAYNEIRQSTIGATKYVIPAIATAWQIFNGDISLIEKNIGDISETECLSRRFSAETEALR